MFGWARNWQRTLLFVIACFSIQNVVADSAANDYITVSSSDSLVHIEVDGLNFSVYAPMKDDSSFIGVSVSANEDWEFVKPGGFLSRRGGDWADYGVKRGPEEAIGGTITFHNYFIRTNQHGEDRDVLVPVGENVIYSARKNGWSCVSDWDVNGVSRDGTSDIVFNRNWWNIPSWFIPSVDGVRPDFYQIRAHETGNQTLRDLGLMAVVGVDGLKINSKEGSYCLINDVLYVEKGPPPVTSGRSSSTEMRMARWNAGMERCASKGTRG